MLGCFAFELASGEAPFFGPTETMVITKIKNLDEKSPELHGTWSEDFKDFVRLCLRKDKDQRPTIEYLLEVHPFLSQVGDHVEQLRQDWIQEYERIKEEPDDFFY